MSSWVRILAPPAVVRVFQANLLASLHLSFLVCEMEQ